MTVFESTQGVNQYRHMLAKIFSLKPEEVRVIAPFVGGGFGGKGGMWNNTVLCAAAAKVANRPVKLALSREGVFRVVGGRTISEQRVALGANKDGRLTALVHSATTATTTHGRYAEQCTFPARHLYASDNFFVGQKIVNLDTVANTWMRAPGESIGTFALESAIDELAYKLKIDPIELRRINEPEKDPTKDTEFSSRNLVEAYSGARRSSAGAGAIPNRASNARANGSSAKAWRRLIIPSTVFQRRLAFAFPPTARPWCKHRPMKWEWEQRPCRFNMPPSVSACRSIKFRFTTAIRLCPNRRWRAAPTKR